ncbi:hypothetical protein F5H01DRAFT_402847 [Linnemannia elongata]|nr:hypothetical protein F5H01DRAFT_402847 [Linnemannia elongata]
MARRTFELDSQPATIRFLQKPSAERAEHVNPNFIFETPSIRMATRAFASLDPSRAAATVAGEPVTFYAGKNPVASFKVKTARRWMDKKSLAIRCKSPTPKAIYKQPPVFKNMRLKDVAEDPTTGAEKRTKIPDEQWKVFFSRLHAPQRYTKEKDFLYLFAHNVIQTNGIKSLYKYRGADKTEPGCRRCPPDPNDPTAEPVFESRRHAFHGCSTVLSLWEQVHEWVSQLQPDTYWSADPNQLLLCWPEVEEIHPVVVHIHSVATNTIWRTYCKLGDKESLYRNQLHWMTFFAIKHRAQVELARAFYRDQKRREASTTAASLQFFSEDPDHYYDKMKKEWEVEPHIMVTKDGVTFGDIWDTVEPEAEGLEEHEE